MQNKPMTALESIQQKIIAFRNERDWAQFHDPKNLANRLPIAFLPSANIQYRLSGSHIFSSKLISLLCQYVGANQWT